MAVLPILHCPKCRKCYVYSSQKLDELLLDNLFASAFSLDGKYLYRATYIRKKQEKLQRRAEKRKQSHDLLWKTKSAVLQLHVRFENRSEKDYIIVNDRREAVPQEGILHYSSNDARELLTAAFCESRNHKGTLDGVPFCVYRPFFADGPHKGLPDSIAPVELEIEDGGGFYSSLVNRQWEIVDMLLYSPFTEKYEIIKATFRKSDGYSFVDIHIFPNCNSKLQ